MRQQKISQIIDAELKFKTVFGEFLFRGKNAGIINQNVQLGMIDQDLTG